MGDPDQVIDRAALERLGWCARGDSAWTNLAKNPPRFAILAPPLDTIPSPQGNAIYVLVERLARLMRLPCVILAKWPDGGEPGASPVSDRILYYRSPLKPGLVDRLPYRVKKILWGTGAPYLLNYATAAAKAIRLLPVQVVMIEDLPNFALVMRRNAGKEKKIVVHQHVNSPRSYSHYWWKKIERCLDGIIFVSKKSLDFTETLHGRISVDSWVVYNGVDLEQYDSIRLLQSRARFREKMGIAENDCLFLFVGRLVPEKGPAETAEAFNLASLDGTHLWIAGDFNVMHFRDDCYLDRLRAASSMSEGRIRLVGNVSQKQLPAYYAAADAVIVPSVGSEGLPKVVTEALAMGKPVLASDRGGTWELLEEGVNGMRIPSPLNIQEFSMILEMFYKNRAQFCSENRKSLGIERVSVGDERMADQIQSILSRLVSDE